MKVLFTLLFILSFNYCYADRVCLEKSTSKLIEYQSGDAPLGTLTKNAENAGYKKEDVIEKYITQEEWEQIKYEQITKPAEEKIEQKEIILKQKEEAIRIKLKLSEDDFQDLKEILRR